MPLWGKVDNAANSDIAALMQVNKTISTAERTNLYGNVTANAYFTNQTIGQFGVDTNEVQANPSIPHSGWVLRKEGTGLRAGRVTYEVLVATGSMTSDGSDDTQFPDYKLSFVTQPSGNSAQTGFVTVRTTAKSTPSGATLTYTWQQNYATNGWSTITNVAGVWTVTNNILSANVEVANANTVRVLVSTAGASTITSGNASITLLP